MATPNSTRDTDAPAGSELTERTSQLLAMIIGLGQSQVISVAARLNIADRLKDRALTSKELAQETEIPLVNLVRLMRTLVQMGLFEESEDGSYKCSEMGSLLQEGSPNSLRNIALLNSAESFYQTWPHLMTGLQTGKCAFRGEPGESAYSYLQKNPDDSGLFQAAMSEFSRQEGRAILEFCDFSQFRNIVDVGGGKGSLLAAILRQCPKPRGQLFDVSSVTEGADALFDAEGLKGRVDIVSGNFLEGVPGQGDLYILKRILMDRTDEDACTLLRNIRQVMEPNGRLMIFDPDDQTLWGKLLDLLMLMNFAGRLRREREIEELLSRTDFELVRAVDTGSPTGMRMYEAVPVSA